MNLILIHPHEWSSTGQVCLTDGRAEHIRRVLHAEPGKTLRVGLLNGPTGKGTIQSVRDRNVTLHCELDKEAPLRPTADLLLALPRPKVMKRLWAQLAALGVGRIILTNAEKVERYYFDSHVLTPEFYTDRLIEGLQQAGDTQMPEVRIIKELKPFLEDELDELCPDTERRFIADPSGEKSFLQALIVDNTIAPKRTLLAVGPEGGWTRYELDLFTEHKFGLIGLGRRILRTDTACIAMLSLLTLGSEINEN